MSLILLNDEKLPLPQVFSGIAFVCLLSLIVWFGRPSNVPSAIDYVQLEATFSSVDGIPPSGYVRMLGIKVGHVASTNFTDDTHQSVTLILHITHPEITAGSLLIPEDSSIRIVTPSIFSDKELLIEPGASFEPLKNGDSFTFTQNSFTLDDLLRYIMQNSSPASAAGQSS